MGEATIEALSARLDVLEARQEIQQVVGRLCRAMDRMDIEAIESCYHALDGFDDHVVFKGGAREFARWFVELSSDRYEETLHCVSPSLVEVDGDVAQVNTACMAHHLLKAPTTPIEPGGRLYRSDWIIGLRYLDRFERREGRWLIAHRKCVFDWMYHSPFEGALRLLPEPNVVWGRRDRDDASYAPVPPSPWA
ncbi:MAG TPA: nuclear transport factor 2 family protein [Ktedonobacterales bacterium]|nr:nuclear transport factor 2 family protein [Ktedonobacterales bacterium]